jgi:uncharacterized membrane protein
MTSGKTTKLVLLALLTAIVIVLQMLGSFIHFGTFQIALALVPIIVGAALCGIAAGGWLGLVFGVVVLLNGDAAAFLTVNPAGTIIVVLVKGIAAGLASGAVYKLLAYKNRYVAVLLASIASPIVNTGIFVIGSYLFFLPTISEWAGGAANATSFIFLSLVGGNFIFEFVVNVVLSGIIVRIIEVSVPVFKARNV